MINHVQLFKAIIQRLFREKEKEGAHARIQGDSNNRSDSTRHVLSVTCIELNCNHYHVQSN